VSETDFFRVLQKGTVICRLDGVPKSVRKKEIEKAPDRLRERKRMEQMATAAQKS